jgi:hypothetical protein
MPEAGSTKTCRVADLAAQAAESMRLHRRLWSDPALIERVNNDEKSPSASELADMLFDRIHALEALACQRQAVSQKGALFQILVCIAAVDSLAENIPHQQLDQGANRRVRSVERSIVRLLYSAAYARAESELDEDLKTLREWYAPRSFHSIEVAERLTAEAE